MKARFVGLALVIAATIFSSHAPAQNVAGEPQRVGQIFIAGNEITRHHVILKCLPFYPGWPLTYYDIRKAEKNLEKLGIFKIDPRKGIRPRITVIDASGENPFKDILVEVEETSTWSVRLMPGFHPRCGPVLSLVFEERNFNAFRPPTSLDDLMSGNAFRGNGELFRLVLVQIPIAPFQGPAIFSQGSRLLPVGWSIVPAKWSRPQVY
jgi:outer membrane protein assembly factor BamA